MKYIYLLALTVLAAPAASIVIFSNPPTTGGVNVTNLSASLVALGHTTSTFSSTSAWATNLNAGNLAVIPDLDADLYAALTPTQRNEISSFVSGGRNLLITGGAGNATDTNAFLNGVFGFSVTATGAAISSNLNNAAATGTPFAGGPATLPVANQVFAHTTSSLPVGTLSIYANGANTTVWSQNFGSGKVIYLAYDWFQGAETNWDGVLGRAVTYGATDIPASGVPEPTTILLTSGALLALVTAKRR